MPISLSEVEEEMIRRIKHHHDMANHKGSGRSGTMKERIRATELSNLLGWIRKASQ